MNGLDHAILHGNTRNGVGHGSHPRDGARSSVGDASDSWLTRLYPHQIQALRKLRNGKILWGGVGSGKTVVAVAYYLQNEAPKDVYVITTAKKRNEHDWQDEFYRAGIGPRSGPTSSGPVPQGSDRKDGGGYPYSLTVDSWNNIGKYADVSGAFFVLDEQRLVGSGAWTKAFYKIAKKNKWILLSATPGDTWLDYVPVFVANGFYKNITEFKREHVVYNTFTKFPKVDRYINVGRLARNRSALLVAMPFDKHTRRRHVEVPLEYDKETLHRVLKERWHVYEDRPLRDVSEMFLVMRKVVNSDPSRLEMVRQLWIEHPKLIVFYNFNFELEILRSLTEYCGIGTETFSSTPVTAGSGSSSSTSSVKNSSISTVGRSSSNGSSDKDSRGSNRPESVKGLTLPSSSSTSTVSEWNGNKHQQGLTSSNSIRKIQTLPDGPIASSTNIAEWNGHKHQPIPKTDRWLYLVQYTAGAEGWNCVETNALVKYSRNYSWRITEQAEGRIDRLNSPFKDLWYYDFTTDSLIDRAIGRSLKAKETFNEARYAGLFKR